jgi:hypothetical protein
MMDKRYAQVKSIEWDWIGKECLFRYVDDGGAFFIEWHDEKWWIFDIKIRVARLQILHFEMKSSMVCITFKNGPWVDKIYFVEYGRNDLGKRLKYFLLCQNI